MNKNPIFCTLFPPAQNVHLIKDVGMIPYYLYKNYGIDAFIACYENGQYPYIYTEVKGLQIQFIKKRKWIKKGLSVLFLLENSKNIDILHIFHNTEQTIIWGILYKLLHPKGILYVKLDRSVDYLEKKENKFKLKFWSFFVNKCVDIISYESNNVKYIFCNKYKIKNRNKVIYIPNGFIGKMKEVTPKKENVIITVGRIGTKEKNNEMFLKALSLISDLLYDWVVYFIGPIENSFQKEIDLFYKENPKLKKIVLFTGNISDRNTLEDYYRQAKIFCLTSGSEGFPLSMVDAISQGCFLLSTNISSISDLSNSGKYAFIINNEIELSERLKWIINNPNFLDDKYNEIRKYAFENFEWNKIIDRLYKALIRK
jgi:glycosyltransferase involved in cell wall biosynthesis